MSMVDVLKFQRLVVCQKKCIDKQCRPRPDRSSLIRVFPVCYSDKHFETFNPRNQHFISKRNKKNVEILNIYCNSYDNLSKYSKLLYHQFDFLKWACIYKCLYITHDKMSFNLKKLFLF